MMRSEMLGPQRCPLPAEKSQRFVALHEGAGAFVIPNPWDAGSARLLTSLGFEALATSSGASAGVLGCRDGQVTDLEKGVRRRTEDAATTIREAGAIGLVDGSIEEASGDLRMPGFAAAVAAADARLHSILACFPNEPIAEVAHSGPLQRFGSRDSIVGKSCRPSHGQRLHESSRTKIIVGIDVPGKRQPLTGHRRPDHKMVVGK
jgi:hypothetical protein